jgi:hypothetical protein
MSYDRDSQVRDFRSKRRWDASLSLVGTNLEDPPSLSNGIKSSGFPSTEVWENARLRLIVAETRLEVRRGPMLRCCVSTVLV